MPAVSCVSGKQDYLCFMLGDLKVFLVVVNRSNSRPHYKWNQMPHHFKSSRQQMPAPRENHER